MKSSFKTLLTTIAAIACLISLVGGWFGFQFYNFAVTPIGHSESEKILFEISAGETPTQISSRLKDLNLVTDADDFRLLGRLTSHWGRLKKGEYELSPTLSPLEILRVITSGIGIQHAITIKEGANLFEIAAIFEEKKICSRQDFLTLVQDRHWFTQLLQPLDLDAPPESLEGFLFPETYFYTRHTTAKELIKTMVKRFTQVWNQAYQAHLKSKTTAPNSEYSKLQLSRYEIIILASMVEKETGAIEERPMIASVFYNRLKKHMPMQSDPTTIYGIWDRYQAGGANLRKQDLLEKTAYNTYTLPRLPIGPIGNPGKEALEAALNPVESEFLYFVSHNNGTHEFTKSYKEHLSAVKEFQVNPEARSGKSWRDLARRPKLR